MEDIIFVKRVNPSNQRTFKNAVIKVEIKGGRFIISQKLAEILKVDNEDGLMFGFNRKAQTGYVVKDDEPDAFILKRKDSNTLRFTSKDLLQFFDDTFGLSELGKSNFVFTVNVKPNEKGLYQLSF